MDRTGVEILGALGLEWGTLGLGALALLIASPTVRRGARSLAVSAMAGGLKMAQGVSDFGGQIREGMTRGMQPNHQQPPQAEYQQ